MELIVPLMIAALAFTGVLMISVDLRPRCSECGDRLPMFRAPATWKQAVLGGWTCPQCGTEVDRHGRKEVVSK